MDWASCLLKGSDSVPQLSCFPVLYRYLINGLLALAGTVAVITVILSGIRFILARNDAKQLEAAHKTFFYALVGVVIILLSFLIINIISFITGVTCINNFGFTNCINIQ